MDTIDPKEFEPGGVFYERGIPPEIADGRYIPYAAGDWGAVVEADPAYAELKGDLVATAKRKVKASAGLVIRKFPVEVGYTPDPIIAELRPNEAVFTRLKRPQSHRRVFEKTPKTYEKHIKRSKVTRQGLIVGGFAGMAKLEAKGYGDGSDHAENEVDLDWVHQHGELGKYQFAGSEKVPIPDGPPHSHEEFKPRGKTRHGVPTKRWGEKRLAEHWDHINAPLRASGSTRTRLALELQGERLHRHDHAP